MNRGNGKHPPLPDSIPVPDMFDLPRYKRPLPVWPEPRSKEQKRPLAKQGYGLDEYAAAISGPERPTTNLKPGNVAQFDGSPESRIAFWSKEPVIKGPIIAKFLKARASGTEYSDEDSAFAVDFASRIILNPFTVLKFISFVDQHDRGVLDYKELLELIFKIAGWELPTDPNTLEKLSTAASLYFVDSDTSGNVGVKKVVSQGVSKPPVSTHKTGSELDADIAPKPHPTKPRTQLTPDSMITVLSKSYLIPVSGYYYDVGEVMFRAHLEKTKEIVDLVRKGSEQGKSSAAADIQQQIEKLRVALRKWMKDLTRGAKKEKENSKKKYMARADRWKKEWDMIVREGKDMEEVFKVRKTRRRVMLKILT